MENPGKILKERFLDPIGVTAYALAKGMGVLTWMPYALPGLRVLVFVCLLVLIDIVARCWCAWSALPTTWVFHRAEPQANVCSTR